MNAIRTWVAALITLAFLASGSLSHAHMMPLPPTQGAAHHAMTHHDTAAGHNHHHQHTAPSGKDTHSDESLNCCSMGGCGFVTLAAPMLRLGYIDFLIFEVQPPAWRSITIMPEAPPPKSIA